MTKFQLHKQRWGDCTDCPLCEGRQQVVLFRGSVPCDVLFVGEAPGQSEDVIGTPFVGPAGHLLDEIVKSAMPVDPDNDGEVPQTKIDLRLGYTNLIACLPLDETGSKVKEPPEESIKKCSDRLLEIVGICRPKLIVSVGKLPEKWLKKILFNDPESDLSANTVTIVHPAAILRAEVAQQTLLVRQAVVTLADAFGELE